MKAKIITNADDLGLSEGVNRAILNASNSGFLSHASLMANTEYFDDAIQNVIPHAPKLSVGLHINLTCCRALSGKSNITDNNGFLNQDFVRFLFMRKSKKNLQLIENEIELQLKRLLENNIKISHIDGHEHVHVIPSVNKIVRKLAKKYGVGRIREINENFATGFKYNFRTATSANIVKFLLLKFLSLFNRNKKKIVFYSILNTCEINAENLFSYLEAQEDKIIEIMLHPSLKEFDKNLLYLDQRFLDFLKSDFRRQEYELCFNKKFEDYVFVE